MLETSVQVVVALLGESLLMDNMEADLRSVPDLSIERLSTVLSVPGLWPAVPHLILTDLNQLHQRTVLNYLERFPDTVCWELT